jgi:hypothetical protein
MDLKFYLFTYRWKVQSKFFISESSKVQSIFQTTVTALSFLAFGGYLVSLLVSSLRGAQCTPILPANATVVPVATVVGRRRRRETGDPSQDMFHTLEIIAEAYAKYDALNRA